METNKYQRGKIYKIVCDTLNLTYYGSTIEPTVAKRLTKHISNYKDYIKNGKWGCMTSFKLFENNNYNIFLVENFPCNSRDELLARERFYIENNECVNKVIPCRTVKERYEANKESIKEKKKEWYEANKESIDEKSKEWRETNKEHLKQKNKEWYEANKEHRKKYEKERYSIKKETPTNK